MPAGYQPDTRINRAITPFRSLPAIIYIPILASSHDKNAPKPNSRHNHSTSQQTSNSLNMASAFKGFLNTARQSISGASTPLPGTPVENTSLHDLFPKVDPLVDGEDCNHDCQSCDIKFPRGFKIDESDKLYGHVKGWSTHVLVATGKTDWVRDVADEKGSVMEAIDKKSSVKPSNGV
jgi:hypothetical protein